MGRGNITVFSKATLAALAGVLVLGLLLGSSATVHAQNQPPLFLTQPYLVSPDPRIPCIFAGSRQNPPKNPMWNMDVS
jgi:hypothetical protein